MLIYKSIEGQNVFDLALQLYGNIQDSAKILVDNPSLNIDQSVPRSTEIRYEDQQNEFKTFLTNKKINLATEPI